MSNLMTPVRAIEKAKRASQAVAIVNNAVNSCRAIRYEQVSNSDYKWWISTCAATPDNRQLIDEVRARLLTTADLRFVALWQSVCNFLESDCRAECALFVDNFFRTYNARFSASDFNAGVFHKVLLAAAHPYQFNDKKMSEVL